MVLEIYLDLAITGFVNIYALKHSFDSWNLTGDIVSGVFAVISTVIVAVSPVIVSLFLL